LQQAFLLGLARLCRLFRYKVKAKKTRPTDKNKDVYQFTFEIELPNILSVSFDYESSSKSSVSFAVSPWTLQWTPRSNDASISYTGKGWSAEINNEGSFTLTETISGKDFRHLFPDGSNIFKKVKNASLVRNLTIHTR
jgi:hypothetical protein